MVQNNLFNSALDINKVTEKIYLEYILRAGSLTLPLNYCDLYFQNIKRMELKKV